MAAGVGLAACGQATSSRDVGTFLRQASTPAERAVLRSIGIYRTTTDYPLACSLVTRRFMLQRFGGSERECEQLLRQSPRSLPRSARVAAIAGERARVLVHERTASGSIYVMRRQHGRWLIDDIVEP